MAQDYLRELRLDPNALLSIKPTNPILKDVFQCIPEDERQGQQCPDRGFAIKQWLVQWATEQQQKGKSGGGGGGGNTARSMQQQQQPPPQQQQQQQYSNVDNKENANAQRQQHPQQQQQQQQDQQYQKNDQQQNNNREYDQQQKQQQQQQNSSAASNNSRPAYRLPPSNPSCSHCNEKDVVIRQLALIAHNLSSDLQEMSESTRAELTKLLSYD